MKKYLFSIILCIITGVIMAKIMFNQYDTKAVSSTYPNTAYFFQVGVFSNVDNMNKEVNKYDSYIYINQDNKYYVYIGITNNKDKLKKYFDNLGYTTYVKQLEIDPEFSQYLSEYDEKLQNTDNNIDIKNINNDILKKYEELNDKN